VNDEVTEEMLQGTFEQIGKVTEVKFTESWEFYASSAQSEDSDAE